LIFTKLNIKILFKVLGKLVNEELDCSGGSSSDIDDPAESSAILTAAICSSTGLNTDRVCVYGICTILSILLYIKNILL
jgi:hypothetical protein